MMSLVACGAAGSPSISPAVSPLRLGVAPMHARKQQMYVGSLGTGTAILPGVAIYPKNASGMQRATRDISGSSTGLGSPAGVAIDKSGKVYVANVYQDSVTVYSATANGNASPERTIKGSNTGLDGSFGVAVDAKKNIYVVNDLNNSVRIFSASANGNVAPKATISGPSTGLTEPVAIALDSDGNVYIVNEDNGGPSQPGYITVYAAGSTGDAAPIQTIGGSNTGLVGPGAVAVDNSKSIYVTDSNYPNSPSVTVYAAGANGNASPTRTISGSNTTLSLPIGIALDSKRRIYVANYGDNNVEVFAAGANGNASPAQVLDGTSGQINNPEAIAVH